MTDIVPAILPDSYEDLAAHVARVRGLVNRVQIDIANGSYAPTKTWPYTHNEHFSSIVAQHEGLPLWEDVSYEVDMLIKHPHEALEEWIDAGVIAAIVHIESTDDHGDIMHHMRDKNVELGWGVKPSTPNEELFEIIEKHGLPDFIQCMGSDMIGHSGVALDDRVYEKVRAIRAKYPELPIAVDIGVNETTAPKLVEAGATKLVSGSAIFESTDLAGTIASLQAL